jgi:hypothetical protein
MTIRIRKPGPGVTTAQLNDEILGGYYEAVARAQVSAARICSKVGCSTT